MQNTTKRNRPAWAHTMEGPVLVIGRQNLQNELLAYGLAHITGLPCLLVQGSQSHQPEKRAAREKVSLALVDSRSVRLDEVAAVLAPYTSGRNPRVPVALFNLEPNTGIESAGMENGVRGFFYAHETLDLFLKGIQAVLEGQIWLPREILVETVISRLTGRQRDPAAQSELTSRESQVLALLGHGSGNEQIARVLGIGRNTVRTHLHSVFRKLGVTNRAQAALWASKHLR